MELGFGVEVSVGESEEDWSREGGAVGEWGVLGVEGDEEEMQELEEWWGGGVVGGEKHLTEPACLSDESDSLCLMEDGGGGRRGTWGAGLNSGNLGTVSGFWSLGELWFDSLSRVRESSCTTTSATSAPLVSSEPCKASSHADPIPEESGDRGIKESLASFCSSSHLFSSLCFSSCSSASNFADSLFSFSFSSSLSSESPNPSWALALAIFLRCCRTWARQGDPPPPLELPGDPVLFEARELQRCLAGEPGGTGLWNRELGRAPGKMDVVAEVGL